MKAAGSKVERYIRSLALRYGGLKCVSCCVFHCPRLYINQRRFGVIEFGLKVDKIPMYLVLLKGR